MFNLKAILNLLFFKYDGILIFAIALLIGFVLASRVSSRETSKKAIGIGILVVAFALGMLLEHGFAHDATTTIGYIIINLLIFACPIVGILVGYRFLSGYSASRWVYGLIGLVLVLAVIKVLYGVSILYAKDANAAILVLLKFMNNKGAVNTVTLLCNIFPAAAIFIDALSTVHRQ